MKVLTLRWFGVGALIPAFLMAMVASAPAVSKTGAAVIGGAVGLGVGAAISKSKKQKKVIYYPGYAPAYPPGGYDPYWNRVISPKPGIFCYPAQYACYTANGSFSPKWTSRMY